MSRPTRSSAAGRAYLDLQNRARRERRGTQELLTMYAVERWLARLSRSAHADHFILKGGMLLAAFGVRRPTVDVDTLARGLASDHESIARRVAEIAELDDPDDGVTFLPDTTTTATIRDDARYAGVRVTMGARLATASVTLRLDVSIGDPVTPAPHEVELPALRPDAEPVRVLGYPIETVLAEKLVTAMDLGPANTRVRDFVDIHLLTGTQAIRSGSLRSALEATAAFRGVTLTPVAGAVGNLGTLRASTYAAYRTGLGSTGAAIPDRFVEVVTAAADFADPIIDGTAVTAVWDAASRRWRLG